MLPQIAGDVKQREIVLEEKGARHSKRPLAIQHHEPHPVRDAVIAALAV